jgi:tRNA threonylcarbamoyladenosine biosynthesis protein TsaE
MDYKLYMSFSITKNEKETFALAKKMAESFKGGEVVALTGDLGAGKTVFTKGLATGLGVERTVNSPTFVVMKNYRIKKQEAIIKELVHIDAYRLSSGEDLAQIGVLDYFKRNDCVTVIEWPEKVEDILPEDIMRVKIEIKKDSRTIHLS